MDRELITKFSWSGKSSDGKKLAFKGLKNVMNMLYETVKAIDVNYTSDQFELNLKNKILRYASE